MGCCGPEKPSAAGEDVRNQVKAGYGAIASRENASCCGTSPTREYAEMMGYSQEELDLIPEEANLGLSCGNPSAMAALQPGEVVLDLGSGAGMDAFLAAARVGETGRVIGVDMTPEMLERSRKTAAERGMAGYVEFREGFIEELPVVSDSVDVVLSNCVINLSPNKAQVFREAYRVLKPGGRLAVSDICLTQPLPEGVAEVAGAYVACLGGASLATDYLADLEAAGFVEVTWTRQSADGVLEAACFDPVLKASIDALGEDTLASIQGTVWSYKIEARKT